VRRLRDTTSAEGNPSATQQRTLGWAVLLALGLRQDEALSLKWDDVDLDKAPCLTADRKNRIPVGQQLRADKNVYPSAAARKTLLVGQVDPRLLVTLSALAHEMSLELVAFDDSLRARVLTCRYTRLKSAPPPRRACRP
jgi:integrase